MPEPMEIERKYLVRPPIPLQKLGTHRVIDIEQFYLASDKPEGKLRYRKCVERGGATFFSTLKRPGPNARTRFESESSITAEEYELGTRNMVPGSHLVHKKRTVFTYDHQEFELDQFIEPALDYQILEIELDTADEEVRLPPFLEIVREVTSEKEFSNYKLAFR